MDADTMKHTQEFQQVMRMMQEEMIRIKVTGESGGGMVKIAMHGLYNVNQVSIDGSLLHDKEMLEDLIAAAVNDGIAKMNSAGQSKLAKMTGMALPFGMNFPI